MAEYKEYITEIGELAESQLTWREKFLLLKDLLERLSKELTSQEAVQFPTFFSRLVFIAQKFRLSKNQEWQLQNMRVRARKLRKNPEQRVSKNEYREAERRVLDLICRVRGEGESSSVDEATSATFLPQNEKLRVQIVAIDPDKKQLTCISEDSSEEIVVQYGVRPENHLFNASVERFWVGAQLNLMDYTLSPQGSVIPRYLVLESDYLIDASAIAECFQNYCVSPLLFTLNKWEEKENRSYLLLGNLANFFLDELVFAKNPDEVSFKSTFLKSFKQSPFEYTGCEDIRSTENFLQFMQKAEEQFNNIKRVVQNDFVQQHIDVRHCTLEPSFFSEKFGFQGRLDLWQNDDKHSKIVELKSGKLPYPASDIGKIAPNHEVQTAVYRLMVESVYGKTDRTVDAAILYSAGNNSGENLRFAAVYHQLEKEILDVRNRIVANEYALMNGDETTVADLFRQLFSLGDSGERVPAFFQQKLDAVRQVLAQASDVELHYFYRYVRFIAREIYLQKIGDIVYESPAGVASLWNTEFAERAESLDVMANLLIVSQEEAGNGMRIVFQRTAENSSIVNFREGDICIVYPRNSDEDTVLNHQILKGTIAEISAERVEVYFRYKQRNHTYFEQNRCWAIEHDCLDSSYNAMYRSLFAFLKSPRQKRELLLGQVAPALSAADTSLPYPENIVAKALAAEDYFLIVGPPGTGKTSIFARRIIEELHKNPDTHILVLAYTNRAVDELCEAIHTAFGCADGDCEAYIRVGTELSCAEAYRNRLLQRISEKAVSREELRHSIEQTRIFVATVASITGRMELFTLKKFQVAIIDEASQILEPQLIGLLPQFEKFILIGDHNQLSTIVLQKELFSKIEQDALNELQIKDGRHSFFERLLRRAQQMNWHHAYAQLSYQGRMHKEIASFSARYFYDENLFPAVAWQEESWHLKDADVSTVYSRCIASQRVSVFSTEKMYRYTPSSKINETEADIIVQLVKNLCDVYRENGIALHPENIGIIAPYRNQIALIKHKLETAKVMVAPSKIMIDTVERFQGSQRDIIILSFCVSKPYQLNFLCNMSCDGKVDRKLNVAITRARKQLFVIGNARILAQNPIYASFLEHYKNNLCVLEAID